MGLVRSFTMKLSSKFARRARLRRRPVLYRPQLLVLEGRILPGFRAPLSYAAGAYPPGSGALGDFDGEGPPYLVLSNEGSNNVSVLLGYGEGTFQSARNFPAGIRPSFVAVGDFRHEGI